TRWSQAQACVFESRRDFISRGAHRVDAKGNGRRLIVGYRQPPRLSFTKSRDPLFQQPARLRSLNRESCERVFEACARLLIALARITRLTDSLTAADCGTRDRKRS